MKIKFLYIIIFLTSISTNAFGMLDPFSIALSSTPESCAGNGTITITSTGLTSGTTTIFSVYETTDLNTAIITTSDTTIHGLTAGNYKVVATQSSTSESNEATGTVTVEDATIPVTYNFTELLQEVCGNDGGFTIDVVSGTSPYEYQILDSNNVVLTSQESPVFSGLSAGEYRIRVLDACGIGRTRTLTIIGVDINPVSTNVLLGQSREACKLYISLQEELILGQTITNYNKTFTVSFTNPLTNLVETYNESTSISNYVTVSNSIRSINISIPRFPGYTIEYNWSVTDQCETRTGVLEAFNNYYQREVTTYNNLANNCGVSYGFRLGASGVQTPVSSAITGIEITSAPASVNVSQVSTAAYAGSDNEHIYSRVGSTSNPLVAGTYSGFITICNNERIPFSYDYQPTTDLPDWDLRVNGATLAQNYCDKEILNHRFYGNSNYQSVQILNPPSTGSFGWSQNGGYLSVYTYDYPPGNYDVKIIDTCGRSRIFTLTVNAQEEYIPSTVTVVDVCGGFNILHESPRESAYYRRYLQYYDEDLGGWTTPATNLVREVYSDIDGENSSLLYKNKLAYAMNGTDKDLPNYSNTSNVETEGRFRVLEQNGYRINGSDGTPISTNYCVYVIEEFERNSTPIFSDIYAFQCSNGTYNVGVNATNGIEPYTYQIVEDPTLSTSDNVILDNGSNPLFTDLAPGSYNFRVIDSCGNINTEEYDITSLGTPQILTTANCDVQEIILKVNGVNYLNFEWYKADSPNTILGTSNSLNLGVWNPSKSGTYNLHLTSTGVGTCVDVISSVTITADPFVNPNAGVDFTVGPITPQPINLKELLLENNITTIDSYGDFELIFADGQTVDNSGNINNDIWYANLANEGIYHIKYTVDKLCGANDEALITLFIRKVCVKSPATGPSSGMPHVGISTLTRNGNSDEWLNGFNDGWIALESRTKGLVITRADDIDHPENTIPQPVEGMIVFDIDQNCIKLYNGTKWDCIYRGCNENIAP